MGKALGNPRLAEARAIANAAPKAEAASHAANRRALHCRGSGRRREVASPDRRRLEVRAESRGGKWEAQTIANIMRRAR